MRCPDCNKFVPLCTDGEPEEESVDVDAESGSAEMAVRIVNTCENCGTELREATLDLTFTVDGMDEHHGEGHELETETTTERTERSEGSGRGRRQFYGVESTLNVTCSCGWKGEATERADIQASAMDEC